MNFKILTIFPEFFESVFSCGVIKKASEHSILNISIHNLRDYCEDKHRIVDDRPYGGGSGMLLKPEPLGKAVNELKAGSKKPLVLLTSPQGELLSNEVVKDISGYDDIIIICGRYEGVDERIKELYVDREISIGDYVLSGGEYAAAVIVDASSRFQCGVIGNTESVSGDSFENSMLKYPQYTRPENYMGHSVPEILLTGDHNRIDNWRKKEALKNTFVKRPDLLDRISLDADDFEYLRTVQSDIQPGYSAYIALVHYPVYNKDRKTISSAFLNLDIHDIARAAKTYGIRKYYLINPVKEQQELAKRVLDHWMKGPGTKFNPTRKSALENLVICSSLEETLEQIEQIEGKRPKITSTDAKFYKNMIGYKELRHRIFADNHPHLILFGTGWGLTDDIINNCDYILKPLKGYNYFNHLSVRSAASVILDRLFSCKI